MSFFVTTLTIGGLTLLFVAWRYFMQHFDYFKNQGIKGPKPIPIFGTWWGSWNEKLHEVLVHRRDKYGKVYGTFDGNLPNTVIADPEILKQILVKDFDRFTNRREFFANNSFLNLGVGSLRDGKWKDVRAAMTPAFSSGKIKNMVGNISECAESLVDYLKSHEEINVKEITVGFTLDVIVSCVLGNKLTSLRKKDDPLVEKALNVIQSGMSPMSNMMFTLCSIYPQLTKLIPSSAFGEIDFFIGVSKKILSEKKANPSSGRTDFLELLLQASKEELGNSAFKNEDFILAQVLIFLLAGFDTSSTALGNILHCLAMNQFAQDKLRLEIQKGTKKHGGINYEFIQDTPYMDQCISEAFRLYPPNSKTERECAKTVTYGDLTIEKGTNVTIPIFSIHRDPETYPEPDKFDPERFSPEEKAKRHPLTYLPFGMGPRGCMGMRFAIEQLKIGLTHLISSYKLCPSKRTNDPPNFMKGNFTFFSIVPSDMWVSIEKCN